MAVALPGRVKDAAARIAITLERAVPEARWVPRDSYHITLKFLGGVKDERVPRIAAALGGAVSELVDFSVRLTGPRAFPSERRARVLWLGVHDPAGGFAILASVVEDALAPLGFPPESRGFSAHLTIARLKTPRAIPPLVAPDPSVAFVVDRASLFVSHLRRPAPVYEELATFPFRRSE